MKTHRAPEALARALPPHVRIAIDRLRGDGFETVVVGGGVRDTLLGRPVHGFWDLATAAPPGELLRLFPQAIPTGIEHGTVTLPDAAGPIEITSFRSDHGYSDARHPDRVTFGATLEGDLARRDFTVNAIAYEPSSERILDVGTGLEDLAARTLRAVGDPLARFREDALRPLRGARLAAVLEFAIEPATLTALAGVADLVPRLSAERVRDELAKTLAAARPSIGLEILREAGLLALVLPELAATVGVGQNRWHAHDVYVHTLRAVDAAPADRPRIRWAALAHDLGKPATRALREDGEATFHGHAELGAGIADAMLERLRFPRAEREAIVHLVRHHLFDYRPEWSDSAVRRFLRRVGPHALEDLFALRCADAVATRPDNTDLRALDALRTRIANVLAARPALSVRDLAVSGRDVMEILGRGPGPEVGHALERLLEEVLEDPSLNERDRLLARLRERAGATEGRSP